MKGDFSRDTFDEDKGYTRVLMQQGRIQVDADWNEQGDIFACALRRLARDVIGAHGGPVGANGFRISSFKNGNFEIGAGRYYVAGLPCECARATTYQAQPNFSLGKPALPEGQEFFVYLEVWEREISAFDDASLLDPALGKEDTTLRSKLSWRVRAVSTQTLDSRLLQALEAARGGAVDDRTRDALDDALSHLGRSRRPKLRASALHPYEDTLLRVEVHERAEGGGPLLLKWSPRNASFQCSGRAERLDGVLRLNVRDPSLVNAPIEVGTWLELLDSTQVAEGVVGRLLRVRAVRHGVMLGGADGEASEHVDQVDLDLPPSSEKLEGETFRARHWQGTVEAPSAAPERIRLGALVELELIDGSWARAGDAWMLPLRTTNGHSIYGWPEQGREPLEVRRRYAPLALKSSNALTDLRRQFRGIASPVTP